MTQLHYILIDKSVLIIETGQLKELYYYMDIKQYIDYFDEISNVARDRQFVLLSNAVSNINKSFRFAILDYIPLFFRVFFIATFMSATYFIITPSIWAMIGAFLLGLLCARIVVTEIMDRLIKQSLNTILKQAETTTEKINRK